MSQTPSHPAAASATLVERLIRALRELSTAQRTAFGLILVFGGFVVYDQLYYWLNREDYEIGFLVPIFVLYVIGERWPRIRALAVGEPDTVRPVCAPTFGARLFGAAVWWATGFAVLMMTLGVFLRIVTGINENSSVLITVGFGIFFMGIAYCAGAVDAYGRALTPYERRRLSGLFCFPAFAWLISAPLLILFEARVKLALLGLVTAIVFGIFDFLGYPIEQHGNVLVMPNGSVGVADACSGIRSLTGCLFAGSFLAAIYFQTWKRKCVLIVAAGVLAVFTNVLRSLFLTGWAYAYGADAIEGTVHDVTGYAVLGVTCVLLLILVHLMNRQWIARPDDDGVSADA